MVNRNSCFITLVKYTGVIVFISVTIPETELTALFNTLNSLLMTLYKSHKLDK